MTFYSCVKRTIDLLFCFGMIVVFGWLLALLWIAVRMSSPGPGIFAQVRVGRNQQPFTCFKFRTMSVGTAQVATHKLTPASVTGFGKILRASKLDELPQIWNLLKGEMSLVGPRPCLPSQAELIEERQKQNVFDILPGITGYSQINGIDMSDPVRLAKSDGHYLKHRSTVLDLRILAATFVGRGSGDKVSNEL